MEFLGNPTVHIVDQIIHKPTELNGEEAKAHN
jgi:hypothetical protein